MNSSSAASLSSSSRLLAHTRIIRDIPAWKEWSKTGLQYQPLFFLEYLLKTSWHICRCFEQCCNDVCGKVSRSMFMIRYDFNLEESKLTISHQNRKDLPEAMLGKISLVAALDLNVRLALPSSLWHLNKSTSVIQQFLSEISSKIFQIFEIFRWTMDYLISCYI